MDFAQSAGAEEYTNCISVNFVRHPFSQNLDKIREPFRFLAQSTGAVELH